MIMLTIIILIILMINNNFIIKVISEEENNNYNNNVEKASGKLKARTPCILNCYYDCQHKVCPVHCKPICPKISNNTCDMRCHDPKALKCKSFCPNNKVSCSINCPKPTANCPFPVSELHKNDSYLQKYIIGNCATCNIRCSNKNNCITLCEFIPQPFCVVQCEKPYDRKFKCKHECERPECHIEHKKCPLVCKASKYCNECCKCDLHSLRNAMDHAINKLDQWQNYYMTLTEIVNEIQYNNQTECCPCRLGSLDRYKVDSL